MYKLAGVFCILTGCVCWGSGKIRLERERIRQLRLWLQILRQVRTEIAYGKHTLPEICLLLTAVKEEAYSRCFMYIYERASAGEDISRVWEKTWKLCLAAFPLREDEQELLAQLPAALCFQEGGEQAGRIGQAEAFLAERLRRADEAYENRTKMIRSVSVLAGLLLAILVL